MQRALWTAPVDAPRAPGEDPAVTGRARLGLAVGAALALRRGLPRRRPGLLSAPRPWGRSRTGPVAGEDAGHMVLDVGADHPAVAGRARGRVDLTTAGHLGVVRVRLRAADGRAQAAPGSREPLLLGGPGGRVRMVHRIVRQPLRERRPSRGPPPPAPSERGSWPRAS